MDTWLIVIIVVSVLVFLTLLLIFWRERTGIYYYVSLFLALIFQGGSDNKSGLATPSSIFSTVKDVISAVPNHEKYTLIDFGCGEGDVIRKLCPMVHKCIGIELSESQCLIARKKFLKNSKVSILCQDMTTYHFSQVPTLFFLYEPLWDVKDTKLESMVYTKVFDNLDKVKKDIVVVYVTGVNKKFLSPDFFEKRGYRLLKQKENPRLLFASNTVYVWKK